MKFIQLVIALDIVAVYLTAVALIWSCAFDRDAHPIAIALSGAFAFLACLLILLVGAGLCELSGSILSTISKDN